tara:strand:+ start:1694 stop:3067 length:1374 start_codon:yes stop_codon:yes gene_type:complete
MIAKKNITKAYHLFLIVHLIVWTMVPAISNLNLPLDTIEALAWGSNLSWGFNKHPPFSAFAVELFYILFGANDWAYYLLSQVFVIIAFIYVWKFSNEIFEEKIYAFISLLAIEGIFFYNYTTPEFNVNISQLPFWALTVYFFWKGLKQNKIIYWFLFGAFSAFGFLSKYFFIYILISLFLYILFFFKKYRANVKYYILSILISLLILLPHFFWLFENNFVTLSYGLARSNLSDSEFLAHLYNPLIFIYKQLLILLPFFLIIYTILKKVKIKISFKNQKNVFLIFITIVPIILVLLTSFSTGAKIRTMWMTPFYLFFGTLFIKLFQENINLKRIKRFYLIFISLFLVSPILYFTVSKLDETKRTDYPGREISRLVQNKWDDNFVNEIKIVVGDEWSAGNLSYHLYSRPIWKQELKNDVTNLKDDQGVIYTGNPKILKEICPGVFGTIKPVGYCMIGRK